MDANDNPTPPPPAQDAPPSVPPVVAPAQDYSQAPSLQPTQMPPQTGYSTSDTFGGMIPTNNPSSLIAYYCAIAGLLPCIAPICAPIAIINGRKGLAAYRANPAIRGKTHSMIGIVMGTFDLLLLLGIVAIFVIAANSH